MRARRIIEGAAFGPEVIRTAIEAFEAAWSEIAERFDVAEHGEARESLATAIISSVREDSRNAESAQRRRSSGYGSRVPRSVRFSVAAEQQGPRQRELGWNRHPPRTFPSGSKLRWNEDAREHD